MFASATTFPPGSAVSGQLNPATETDLYRFDVPAGGGRYYFDMRSLSISDGSWRLLNSYGDQVFQQWLYQDVDVTTLAAGTYLLALEGRRYNTGTNSYQFNVQPVVDDTAALTLGQRVDGQISSIAQADRFTFSLAEAKRL